MTDRRRRLRAAVFAFAVLPANAAVLVMATTPATAGTGPTTNACLSNATATYSDLTWTLSGEATPDPASVGGGDVTLSGSTVGVNIPATLLIAGYNLGLLTTGANDIPTIVYVARTATNVEGGTETQIDTFNITASTTITDPNGTPGTGDETATPLAVSESLPDMVVTPTGGDVTFAQGAPGSIVSVPLGTAGAPVPVAGSLFAQASVGGGLIKARFDCSPGTTVISPPGGTSGPTFTPAVASPFETVTVTGGSSTTTSSTTSTSTTSTSTTSTSTTTSTTSTSTTSTTAPPGATTVTGTETFVGTCKNSVTPDLSELTFEITGTAPAQAVAGDTVTLSDQSWTVGVPASVLNSGLGLGLLNIGDTVAGTVKPSLFATNTEEGTRVLAPISVQVGPIESDGSGSVPPKAKPASVTFAVPDTSWTTVGGTVAYSMGDTSVEVVIGPLKVLFSCTPKNTALSVVETSVSGSTGVPPAGRPGAPTEVLGNEVTPTTDEDPASASLPRTGSELFWPVAIAVALLDLGYLLETAVAPARRRRRPAAWT